MPKSESATDKTVGMVRLSGCEGERLRLRQRRCAVLVRMDGTHHLAFSAGSACFNIVVFEFFFE